MQLQARKEGSESMQNRRRRQFYQLSRLLWHSHLQFTNRKTPPQQLHFNEGNKVYDIGHLQLLFNDSPENKRICENETFGLSPKK